MHKNVIRQKWSSERTRHLISPITYWHVTRFISRHFIELMNEWQGVRCFQCLVSGNRIFKNWSKTDYKTICFKHRRRCFDVFGRRKKTNKTTQRKTQTDVAFVMTFRVNCGEQKQKQPTPGGTPIQNRRGYTPKRDEELPRLSPMGILPPPPPGQPTLAVSCF